MKRSIGMSFLLAVVTSLVVMIAQAHAAMPICNAYRASSTYEAAKQTYPDLEDAIQVVQRHGVVPWYTDNMDLMSRASLLATLATCGNDTKIPMVVYGIPNKDCEANYSNAGHNKDMDDYEAFITTLATVFPTQHMVYIIEPDAVGLTANGGCGVTNEYATYLKFALEKLSTNPNAELFLDIGFWTLLPNSNPDTLAKVVNDVWPAPGRLKGIALNTANYQATDCMVALCDAFARRTNHTDMQCVIDSSRNHRGPAPDGEWCNYRGAGIGAPPTMDTGNERAAYYLWIKPPGESDGTCEKQRSSNAMVGPTAGAFFREHFDVLWKNGWFVGNGTATPTNTSTMPINASTKPTPTPTPTPTPPSFKFYKFKNVTQS